MHSRFGIGLELTRKSQPLHRQAKEFGFYYGSPKYDTQREFYHPTYSFGLNWTPVRER